ncbi:Surfeit locus protein 4 [Porphyridium purpureum]|uniref:Surfeit locus protein 4 n=1 Tax=Porphyridium purpureum TaxID=35688 RepID=A0A5J4YLX1_PORPP|nr:Surfeit locus protein 4 [Porphyridium purpureum]|eukprot:POR1371..scf244_11
MDALQNEAVKKRVKQVNDYVKRVRKVTKPYLPMITRVLIIATFVEDGIRVLLDIKPQANFLTYQYSLPFALSVMLIASTTLVSLAASAAICSRKPKLELYGCYAQLGYVFYQQVLYGRHSPIGSGNFGFLMRNLCLAGTLLMLIVQNRLSEGHTALPGIPDPGDKSTTMTYIQLGARALLVLLSLEFLSNAGAFATLVTIPVLLAVLLGFQTQISGTVLLIMYFLHNVSNSAFWAIKSDSQRNSFDREVKRYEFVQTLSIMGGLMLLISTGPGQLSVDSKMGRQKNF